MRPFEAQTPKPPAKPVASALTAFSSSPNRILLFHKFFSYGDGFFNVVQTAFKIFSN